jgi:hypothetical protein
VNVRISKGCKHSRAFEINRCHVVVRWQLITGLYHKAIFDKHAVEFVARVIWQVAPGKIMKQLQGHA